MEQFYGKIKLLDFDEINNKNQQKIEIRKSPIKKEIKKNKKNKKNKKSKIEEMQEKFQNEIKSIISLKENGYLQNKYLFSFDNFSEYYQKNLRVIINKEQENDKENFSKVKSITKDIREIIIF